MAKDMAMGRNGRTRSQDKYDGSGSAYHDIYLMPAFLGAHNETLTYRIYSVPYLSTYKSI